MLPPPPLSDRHHHQSGIDKSRTHTCILLDTLFFVAFLFFLNGFAWLSHGAFALFALFAFLSFLHYSHSWDAVGCPHDQKWLPINLGVGLANEIIVYSI